MKNILKVLAKSVLRPLRLIAASSAADAGIHQKILGLKAKKLIISNAEMYDIIKIIKYLEEYDFLMKVVSKTIKNETKETKGGFLGMLLGTLVASLLGNLLTNKGVELKCLDEE